MGFLVTGSSHFDPSYAEATRRRSREFLNTLGVEVLEPEAIAFDLDGLKPMVAEFKRQDIGLLVVQAGSFSWDNLAAHVAMELPSTPLVLWAVREPPMDGGLLKVNSLCSVMMNGAACAKLGKDFRFVYGNPEEAGVKDSLARTVRAASARNRLRQTRLGLVGYRPPGFYGSTFNEMGLRRTLGVELEHISLGELYDAIAAVTDEEAQRDLAGLMASGYRKGQVADRALLNLSRVYLATRKCIATKKVSGLALKCWPELFDKDMLTCLANSRLNSEGIPVACEADVHGLVSQVIETYLTGEPTFFCDLVDVNEEKNTVFLWHCGAAPRQLAANPGGGQNAASFGGDQDAGRRADRNAGKMPAPQINTQPNRRAEWNLTCPMVEFPLKPGRVTFCRLYELDGEYRLFYASGEALPIGQEMHGNCSWVRLDAGARETVEFIVNQHVEHHFAMAYGDLGQDLVELCRLTGVRAIACDREARDVAARRNP